jgi:hypothetical protein
LVPVWGASEAVLQGNKDQFYFYQVAQEFHWVPMRGVQQDILRQLVKRAIDLQREYASNSTALSQLPTTPENDDLRRLLTSMRDVVPAMPAAVRALCYELSGLERRLVAYPRDSLSAALRQHVDTLVSTLAPVFNQGAGGACTR